jgi:GNAT superfamily N-acetyltransferase
VGFFVQKVQRNVDDYGWLVTAKKSIAHLFGIFYFEQVYRIYRIDLRATPVKEEFGGQNLTFRTLAPQDAVAIAQIEGTAEWLRGNLSKRLADGCLCLVAMDGEEVAGFNLIDFGKSFLSLVKLKKKLRMSQAWSEHIAVEKKYRRSGVASQLRYRIFEELRKRGVRWLYGGTLRYNTASLNLTRSVGFKEFVDIHYVQIFGFEYWRFVRVRS